MERNRCKNGREGEKCGIICAFKDVAISNGISLFGINIREGTIKGKNISSLMVTIIL